MECFWIAPGTYYYEDYLDSDNIATRPVLDPVVIIRAAALGVGIFTVATAISGFATLHREPAGALHDE